MASKCHLPILSAEPGWCYLLPLKGLLRLVWERTLWCGQFLDGLCAPSQEEDESVRRVWVMDAVAWQPSVGKAVLW